MSELQKAVADILVKATQAAEAAGKFAVEQLPDVAQQYVLYKAIFSGVSLIICFVLLAVLIHYSWKIHKWVKEEQVRYVSQRDVMYLPLALIWLFGGSALVINIYASLNTFILAVWAPKVLLIQWATDLVK